MNNKYSHLSQGRWIYTSEGAKRIRRRNRISAFIAYHILMIIVQAIDYIEFHNKTDTTSA